MWRSRLKLFRPGDSSRSDRSWTVGIPHSRCYLACHASSYRVFLGTRWCFGRRRQLGEAAVRPGVNSQLAACPVWEEVSLKSWQQDFLFSVGAASMWRWSRLAESRRYEVGQEGSAEEQGEMPCLKVLPRCFGSESNSLSGSWFSCQAWNNSILRQRFILSQDTSVL